jgi:YidC/Oxa1 family membrane protein insertase
MQEKDFHKRVLTATILSAVLITIWMYAFGGKKIENIEEPVKQEQTAKPQETKLDEYKIQESTFLKETEEVLTRQEALRQTKRVSLENSKLSGSISLQGLKFDDIILKNYKTQLNSKDNVVLLSPLNTEETYFVDFGWLSADSKLHLPSSETVWKADSNNLTAEKPVTFTWKNQQGLIFTTKISIDNEYMFNIQQSVTNKGVGPVALIPFGRINKRISTISPSEKIVHQGAIGSFNLKLEETAYAKLQKQNYEFKNGFDWMGITDKYWQTVIIADKNYKDANVDFKFSNNYYKAEFKGKEIIIHKGKSVNLENNMFAGAKELSILDNYAKNFNIPLFDRSVDFGWFYFLTKPLYLILRLFYTLVGNFGVAILLLTLLIKGGMYPMAKKSFVSMAKMKKLKPKTDALKIEYNNDKIGLNKATMQLYQKEGANPMSGCLPTLIQIPVFFSLYKVLSVTIDMRHAPFFGYIKDLSAPDMTTIWNLFGLLPYQVRLINIGLLPCLMSATMFIQQQLNAEVSADPTTQSMTKYMPLIFLFIFANFPSGLLIYWIFSNMLAIAQQWWINKSLNV